MYHRYSAVFKKSYPKNNRVNFHCYILCSFGKKRGGGGPSRQKCTKGLSILTPLRVGLSKLNFHKFKHNFRDTLNPLCPTNDGVEDTEHYFLLCRTYDANRLDLLNSVNAILLPHGLINLSNEELLKIILYGHEQII